MSNHTPRVIIIAKSPAVRQFAVYWTETRRNRILRMLRQKKSYDEIAASFNGQTREAIRQVIDYYRIGWGERDIWLSRPNVNLTKHGIKIVQSRRKATPKDIGKKVVRKRTRYR